jgi:hypothetical protein
MFGTILDNLTFLSRMVLTEESIEKIKLSFASLAGLNQNLFQETSRGL